MDWTLVPWGAVVTLGGVLISRVWTLTTLASDTAKLAAALAKDFKEYKDDVEKADDKRETKLERAFASTHSDITLTNTRISVVEHSITEIRATAITRGDLEKMEGRMVGNITAIGERIDDFMSKVAVSKVSDRTRS